MLPFLLSCCRDTEMFRNFVTTISTHPLINLLGVIDDFRDSAVEAKEPIGYHETVTSLCEGSHAREPSLARHARSQHKAALDHTWKSIRATHRPWLEMSRKYRYY